MRPALLCLLLLPACFGWLAFAAEESQSRTNVADAIKAQAAKDAKQGAPKATGPAKSQAAANAASPAAAPAPAAKEATAPAVTAAEAAKAGEQAATVLPPVEVRKRKLSEFERDIRIQETEIIREKKNTVPTEVDKALNDSKISRALAIFGGQSGEYRASIASERVSMMEDEKDIIEAINNATTPEEKQTLQKQLVEMRKMRRELEKSLK
jgi:hypothetical protein